jgi:hypothetical protein
MSEFTANIVAKTGDSVTLTFTPQANVECPAFYVPVPMRETGRKGAEDVDGEEAYT